MNTSYFGFIAGLILCCNSLFAQDNSAHNPIIWADVPDMSMVRVGDSFYMSSTTMHMCPGVPIMKSRDLVNWQMVNYAYNTLGEMDALF
jgi:beta-xylosidase